jgi:hypothetical protein
VAAHPRTIAILAPPRDELLATAVSPRGKPRGKVRGSTVCATSATPRAAQQNIMQAQMPLESSLKGKCVCCLLRQLDLLKDLRSSASPVYTQVHRNIEHVAAWRDKAVKSRVLIDAMPLTSNLLMWWRRRAWWRLIRRLAWR